MKNPVSTYRVQLSPEFTFDHLQEILDYLEEFGISTIYSAPIFQARKGSNHGYDITDPFKINREIGRLEALRKISERLRRKNMTWLQDIVPNHMAFDGNNVWLHDIFELGPESKYYNYFDVDWDYKGWQKMMAPFLGKHLDEVLKEKELQLFHAKKGIFLNYFDHYYPVSAKSYATIFTGDGFAKWQEKFSNSSGEKEDWQELKEFFLREVEKDQEFRNKVQSALQEINSSEEKLRKVLDEQYFLPTHWKKTEQEINFRRFFTINDLICLRMEDREVFDSYHRFILQLCDENIIQGLRIDHIDGLFDPKEYLEFLREELGDDFYIIVEKILELDEKLPLDWSSQGTSGYAFLAFANQLFTKNESREKFTSFFAEIDREHEDYEALVYEQKLFILKERMGGEYNNLWKMAGEKELVDSEDAQMKEALGAFLAAFPVYRIYPEEFPLKKKQKKILEEAFDNARSHNSALEGELEELKKLFLGEADKKQEDMLSFLQRCQQFTGPLAAKGGEDTSFYIYNRLISHNEVGDSPENFGISVTDFHQRMEKRAQDFPLSINATATHDTKRGEDARMRINVLSELTEEWLSHYKKWKELSQKSESSAGPDANEEYFIYQMLLGAWPHETEPGEEFLERSKAYLMKVLREAKVNSSWAAPNEEYEQSVFDFLNFLLKNDDFRKDFLPFQKKISAFGAIKSLSQSLLKITAPGIPDVYQGTELWDLSYVDPDNRRPVNYQKRQEFLSGFDNITSENVGILKKEFNSGKIKMFCLHKALKLRQKFSEVFEKGRYISLETQEGFSENLVTFCRKKEERYILIVAPVLVTEIFNDDLNLKPEMAGTSAFSMPEGFPEKWKNVFTETEVGGKDLKFEDLFKDFPVALLTNEI